MHIENRYYIRPGVIEVEQVHSSMVGNHNRRSRRHCPSADAVKKNNKRRVAKKLRRLIDTNFMPGDLYMTLTYKKGTSKTLEEVEKDLRNFIKRLGYRYEKLGQPLKWIAAVGIKAPHVHLIINTIDGFNYMKDMANVWGLGFIDIKPLYIEGRYMALAEYLVKHKEENEKKLGVSLKNKRAYMSSRNLKQPRKRTIRINEKVVIRKPKVPTGYRLDMYSEIDQGIYDDTNYHYRYFMLIRAKKRE